MLSSGPMRKALPSPFAGKARLEKAWELMADKVNVCVLCGFAIKMDNRRFEQTSHSDGSLCRYILSRVRDSVCTCL